MKDGVIFLNLARGSVVEISALVKAIKSGKVEGAGVDVFPEEPKTNQDPFVSELQGLSNVILTLILVVALKKPNIVLELMCRRDYFNMSTMVAQPAV